MFALLRTRRYPEGGVGSSRHIPGERPACWVPWLAQRPWRPLVRPKGPRAPCFIRKGGINNNNNTQVSAYSPSQGAGAARLLGVPAPQRARRTRCVSRAWLALQVSRRQRGRPDEVFRVS